MRRGGDRGRDFGSQKGAIQVHEGLKGESEVDRILEGNLLEWEH